MNRLIFALLLALAVLSRSTLATRLICLGPNEEYQCGSACQTTCATLGQPCPIINIKCNDACYCKDGYARNSKGICIPISACPAKVVLLRYGKPKFVQLAANSLPIKCFL